MPMYLYRGYHEDISVTGNRWDDAGVNFQLALIKGDPNLDTPGTGLNNPDIIDAQSFFSRAAVNEITVADITNYIRKDITSGSRRINWNPAPTPQRQELFADDPLLWTALATSGTGATIGAYCIIRGNDANDANNRIWMADSSGTNLPTASNGQDFTVTLSSLGWLWLSQPNFGV